MYDSISFDTAENKALYGGIFGGAGITLLSFVCLGVKFYRLYRKRKLRQKFDERKNEGTPELCLNVDSEVKRDPYLPPVYNQTITLEQHHESL